MKDQVKFLIQGSAPDPYEVKFYLKSSSVIIATCTCPAGQNGTYCKHRINLLQGNLSGLVSGNEDQASVVISWLSGTHLASCLKEIAHAEKQLASAKAEVSRSKKNLASAMLGLPYK